MKSKKVKVMKDIKEVTKERISFPISVKFPVKGAGGTLYWEDNYAFSENGMSRAFGLFLVGANDVLDRLNVHKKMKDKVLSDCNLVWMELVARDIKKRVPIDRFGKPVVNTYGFGRTVCITKCQERKRKYYEKGQGMELDIEREIINLVSGASMGDKQKALDFLTSGRGDLQDDIFKKHVKIHPDNKKSDEIKDAKKIRFQEWEEQLSSGKSFCRNQEMAEAGVKIQVDVENDVGPYQWLQSQDGYNHTKDEPNQNYINLRLLEEMLPASIFKLVMMFFAGQRLRFPPIQDLLRVNRDQKVYATYKKFQERKKYWRTQKRGNEGSLLYDEKGEPIWETSIKGGMPSTIRDIAKIHKMKKTTVGTIIKSFEYKEKEAVKRAKEYKRESAFLHPDTEIRLRGWLWALSRYTKALLHVDVLPWIDSNTEVERAKREVEEKMKNGKERVKGTGPIEPVKVEPRPEDTETEKTRPVVGRYEDQSTIHKFKKPSRRKKKGKDKGIWHGKVAEDKEAETSPEVEDEGTV